MNGKTLIEGILLLAVSIVGMLEGYRLIFHKNPNTQYDVMGPGLYIVLFSIAMMATGIVHLIVNYGKPLNEGKIVINKETRRRMVSMVAVLAIYTFLLDFVGYLMATVVFFLLEFRTVGVRSWLTNVILTVACTVVLYIVFVEYCNITFPRGMFF
jgi:putative tricarboxylic transport membrane protein